MLTADLLAQLPFPPAAESVVAPFVDPLNAEMAKWEVDSPLRRAHFLAQICHESAGFSRLVEDLFYTHVAAIAANWEKLAKRASLLVRNPAALANAAYAGENGNGDEASGDGFRFRGRGLIQITGRANYAAIGAMLGLDLLADPDRLLAPDGAVKSALAFWKRAGCNVPADADNVPNVTRLIAGPRLTGLADRSILKKRALDLGM